MKKETSETVKLLGEKVMVLRKRKDLTQSDFAKRIGISTAQMGRLERGDANSTISVLIDIANEFGITLSELVDVAEKHNK